MSFDLKISLDDGGAVGTLDKVTAGMQGAEAAATKTTAAMSGVGTAAEQAGEKTSASTGRMAEALERVAQGAQKWGKTVEEYMASSAAMDQKVLSQLDAAKASLGKLFPEAEMQSQIISLDRLLVQGRIGVEQYDAQLVKLQVALGKSTGNTAVSDELEREVAVFERIKGPMRSYNADVTALERLLAQGKVTAAEFDTELERLNKKAGVVYGPTAPGPGSGKGQAIAKDDGGGVFGDVAQTIGQHLGPAGQVLGASLNAGALGAAAMTAGAIGLGVELAHLDDRYTELVQKITRFTESGTSANEIIAQQFELSKELHADLDATVGLYSRIRESTEELNLSQRQQIQLTREVGESVVGSGRSIESAEALTRRLSLAFSSGAISGRELRSIMKEYPEIATGFADALGHSRQELIAMANKGEISAQQIIGAFDKMAPMMEARMKAMPETIGQSLGHVKDAFMVGWNQLADATVDPVTQLRAKLAREYLQEAASLKQLNAELEKNARLAPIIAAAKGVGLSVGGFDLDAANKISEVRIAARGAGLDIADAFANAKDKAQLYSTEIDKIKDANAAKQIAEDAKRIYEAMSGVDDAMKKQFDRWKDMADQVSLITKQIDRWKSLTPAGVPTSQEQRDLELQLANTKTDQADSQYGKQIVTYAQGLNTARAELEALSRAQRDGVIQGEAARQKYDSLMTTLNDGRLPEAIKLWEGIHLPIEQFQRDIRALDALLAQNRVTLVQYNAELHKLEDARFGADVMAILRPVTEPKPYKPQSVAIDLAVHEANVAHDSLISTKEADLEKEYKFPEAPNLEKDIAAWDKRAEAVNANLKEIDPLLYAQKQHELMLQEEKKILEQLNGPPIKQYELGLKAAGDLLEHHKISAEQYAKAVDNVRAAYLAAAPAGKTFEGALELEWLKMKQDADNFGASVAKLAVDDLGKLNDAIVTAANGGTVAWGQMADAMIQDLERIALKMLEVKLIEAGVSLFASSAGGSGGTLAAGSILNQLGGFATGGSFVVGGDGGIDTTPVAFRATRGERVTISPPGAYPMPSAAGGGSASASQASRATVVNVHNHYDKSIGIAAIDSPGGNRSVLNVLRANQGAVRSYSGTRR